MKLNLVVLLASVALCAGFTIPQIPGDNSHYVEGESRYIWMPDGDGKPHLVDLQAPPEEELLRTRYGANNQYWLYTRRNPTSPQILINRNVNSVQSSNFQANRPTAVIAHGWNSDGNAEVNTLITSALLAVDDCNVIVLDWSSAASGLYTTSVLLVPNVGQHLGNFLQWLINTTGSNWTQIHLIGHSLGAHIMGNAGRHVWSQPQRITGLDPAGPLWGENSNALNRLSGVHVESIHTDGGLLGIMDPISDADFYPNGGRNPQPGCLISTCSHSRAYELFASSVKTNHFVGRLCENFSQADNSQCTGPGLNMGNNILTKRGSGLYGLFTGRSWPF